MKPAGSEKIDEIVTSSTDPGDCKLNGRITLGLHTLRVY